MSNFAVINNATGNILRVGDAPSNDVPLQAGAGETAIELPAGVIAWPEPNLVVFRDHLLAQIDAEAEATRGQFISAGSGQLGSYLNKQAEAAAYLANNATPTPYLTAEAAATGTTVAALAALVHATALAWVAVDAKIEAARRGAKVAVEAAKNIATMHAAATVKWAAVVKA